MNNYLQSSKAAIDIIETFENVYVVLGNESCDLDSCISALIYGYYYQNLHNSPDNLVISVLNIAEDEFPLRTESKYFLQKHDINAENLVFRNQLNLTSLAVTDKLKLILLDHHVLPEKDQNLRSSVIEIIDHRPLDPSSNWKNILLNIDLVGSCTTLVAKKILDNNSNVLDETMAKLLHGTIVLDTINFNQNANRYTKLDVDIANKLEKSFNISESRENIFNELVRARSDISELTPFQILHRDLKIINNLPVPGVPMLLIDFLDLPDAVDALKQFCQTQKCKVIVAMGLISKNNVVYRDIAVFSMQDCELKTAVVNHLRSTQELCLTQVNRNIDGLCLFSQGNVKASRKHIVPILKTILEKYSGNNVL